MRLPASRTVVLLVSAVLCVALLVPATVWAQQIYPPPPAPGGESIGDDDDQDDATSGGAGELAEDTTGTPGTDPEDPSTPPLDAAPAPELRLAPPPSDTAPVLAPGTGQVEVDGVFIDLIIRVGPERIEPDDPVLRLIGALRLSEDGTRLLGLPPRADGSPREPLLTSVTLVQFGDTALVLMAEDAEGTELPVDPESVLVLVRSGRIIGSGAGFESDSELAIWFFSEATLLGTSRALPDGTLAFVTDLGEDVALGTHVLQFTGHVGIGVPFRLSADVRIVDPHSTSANLLAPRRLLLVLAVLGVLLLLVLRRRRRDEHRVSIVVRRGPAGTGATAAAGRLTTSLRAGLAAATLGREPLPVELRAAALAPTSRDRALVALEARIIAADVHDLAAHPVPVDSVLLVESGALTLALSATDRLGVSRPLDTDVLRLAAGGELLVAAAGLRPGSVLWLGLSGLGSGGGRDQDAATTPLGSLRADEDGRARGRLAIPDEAPGDASDTAPGDGEQSVLLLRARTAPRRGPEGI